MSFTKSIVSAAIAGLLIFSCGKKTEEKEIESQQSRDRAAEQDKKIAELEKSLDAAKKGTPGQPDPAKAAENARLTAERDAALAQLKTLQASQKVTGDKTLVEVVNVREMIAFLEDRIKADAKETRFEVILTEAVKAAKENLTQKTAATTKAKTDHDAKDKALKDAQAKLTSSENEIKQLTAPAEKEIAEKTTAVATTSAAQQKAATDFANADAKKKDIATRLENSRTEKGSFEKLIVEQTETLNKLKAELDKTPKEEEEKRTDLSRKIVSSERIIIDAQKKVGEFTAGIAALEKEEAPAVKAAADAEVAKKNADAASKAAREALKAAQEKLANTKKDKKFEDLQKTKDEVAKSLDKLQKDFEAALAAKNTSDAELAKATKTAADLERHLATFQKIKG